MAIVAPPRERTQPRPDDTTTRGGGWHVVAFNNDYNTFAEVIEILIVATGCTREEAEIETWEIDRFGSCVVHRADRAECERVAEIISSIGVKTEVEKEE
ncbi:MAG: Clp protease ClpS [Armatimonadota bacterium]